ncbi:GvpL/GvpF family gas vesicle protein [Streptomyces sp. SL13]|jgi:hypothetical protein|uniref:GvpL/GvpF family gas vesicle protein n=1 Tax=Streptantibioticus silvisoli TaxID=2705255 RepID=A0AA90GW97_9ACTN|nr:GvpL/GvpF family gas vesicle protein [Streptantibioticus silvisoli]MDI5969024.1 GvpL/GvpF family gas vesicle protein [Streptantibioticus silvisoli]
MPTYLYAVTAGDHPARLTDVTGVGDPAAPVRVLSAGPLKAVVGDAPDGLRAKRRDLLAHQRVLDRLMEDGAVLPMRFGLIGPDDERVRAVVEDNAAAYTERLGELGDCREYNLKVSRDEDDLLREIIATVPEARRLNDVTRGDPGAHRERRALGEIVAREVQSRQDLTAQDMIARLAPNAVRQALAEPTGEHFLNVSFLVAREQVAAFSEAVHQEAADRGDAYTLSLNGPLPPYSFV